MLARTRARARRGETLDADEQTLILSVDTATEVRSVAVARGSRIIALKEGEGRNTHSANVLLEIDAALREAGVELREIELFAVASGPGSFTGLRAGLASIKAFAATLHRPVVGVPTLHAVAHAAGAAERLVAAIPAGRGELFAQLLRVTREGAVVELEAAAYVAPDALIERAAGFGPPLVWAGGGAHAYAEALSARALQEGWPFVVESGETSRREERVWTLAPRAQVLAGDVATLALAAFRAGQQASAFDLRAFYVRPSDAEIKEQCRAPKHTQK